VSISSYYEAGPAEYEAARVECTAPACPKCHGCEAACSDCAACSCERCDRCGDRRAQHEGAEWEECQELLLCEGCRERECSCPPDRSVPHPLSPHYDPPSWMVP